MQAGGYEISTIEAGRLGLDGGAMFGIVPRPLWERSTQPDEKNRIALAMRCLLLRGHGRTILVDTGVGHKSDAKFEKIYAVDHEHSTLEGSLRMAGVAPGDVTDVILTHLHFDHVGGATQRGSDGSLNLTFPQAAHYVQRSHLQWSRASPRESASFLADNIQPLVESGKLVEWDGSETPFPNISMVIVDGHTHGQQLPIVRNGETALLYAADLVPTSAHVSPLWIMAYDVEPLVTLAEKERILDQAAEQRWLVVYEHDPDVVCSRIEKTASGYRADSALGALPDSLDASLA